ncbi:MAG: polyamine ABC transporter substrate-binding protein [Gammaproteobacteria bacterium]|nr:polyamine ABC transporter substrate-binding protein [Gammaproteobacteria bacterium]
MPDHPAPGAPLLLGALICAAAFSATAAEEPVVNMYNWTDYIGPDTLRDFERETGIRVNYDVYTSSEIVDAKLMAGGSGYDVVIHSATFTRRLFPIGLFRPLDKGKLPNWRHLEPDLIELFGTFDPGLRYTVPYMWGTTGFTYNVDMVRERFPDAPLDSAAFIFKPENAAKLADCGISLLDSPTDVIPTALLYLGYQANSVKPEELKEAGELLSAIRPYIKYFDSTKLLNDLPNREVCVAMSWSGDYSIATTRAREAGLDIHLEYFVPKEGVPFWLDAAYIPTDAPHPDNAYKLLDFLLRPDVIAEISNYTGYANANRDATPLVNPEFTGNPALYPDAATLKRLHSTSVLPPKIERLRSRTWTRVRTGL